MNKINPKQILKLLFFALAIFSIVSSIAQAGTIRVPEDYATIQEGINAAVNGDTVLVNDGTYPETIDFLGKAITLTSVNGALATKIVGESSPIVAFQNGEGLNSIIDGFTIMKDVWGGGVQGIYCFSASPTIQNNIIVRTGGGIYADWYSFPTIKKNLILGNYGGGVYSHDYSNPLIQENSIIGNYGSGVYARDYATLTAINNTIVGNWDGVDVGFLSTPFTVENNIIALNSAYGFDREWQGPQPILSHNNVWGNGQGDYNVFEPGEGDISEDPLFEGLVLNVPADCPTITEALVRLGKFYLGQGSLCIGADSNGNNIGAYPVQATYLPPGDHQVYVAGGTYYESIVLPPFTELIGAGPETTILDAQGDFLAVRIVAGMDQNLIEGFTIRNGRMGIWYSRSSPTIQNNIITNNEEDGIHSDFPSLPAEDNTIIQDNIIEKNGLHGIHVQSSYATIQGNIVRYNGVYGIHSRYSAPTIRNNTIANNKAEGIVCSSSSSVHTIENNTIFGNGINGIQCSWSSPTIQNNIIFGNETRGIYLGAYGGTSDALTQNNVVVGNGEDGIRCRKSSPVILNNTIAGNGYSGVYCIENSSPAVENNIITSNRDYGISALDTSLPLSSYNNVWGNEQGGYNGISQGLGDISADPLFEGLVLNVPVDYPTITEALHRLGKFYLGQESPCIGADSNGNNMGGYPTQVTYLPPGNHEVHVAAGTYHEAIALPPFTELIGAGALTTILDAQGENHVIRSFGGSDQNIIRDFAIRNGQRGIFCIGSSALIKNNSITGNEEEGIRCDYSSPTIEDNTITGNTGKGILSLYSYPTVLDNVIKSNTDDGIYCRESSATIQNNVIANNTGFGSDGIYGWNSSMSVVNNTITGNYHGVYNTASPSLDIFNNIISSNEAYGIWIVNSNFNISYNDVWNNPAGNYGYDATPGAGDISEDPLFVNPANENFHLQASSSCIDAGDNSAPNLPAYDFEGDPRILRGTVDIGADEVYNTPPAVSALSIMPSNPLWIDDLVANYSYADANGDPETYSQIRWWRKNGELWALQSDYNDLTTLPASATAGGEEWRFSMRPNDGFDFGGLEISPAVTIQRKILPHPKPYRESNFQNSR